MSGLRVGVVGLGLGRIHAEACAASPLVGRLVLCDPDAERRERIRAGLPREAAGYAGIEEMLERERPDAVSVVTPDHLHRSQAEMCLAAGCHVLVTKPLATTVDDARAMVRAAEHAGRKLMVAQEARFRPATRRLRELLDSGALGEVVEATADAIYDKRGHFAASPWYASAQAGRTAMVGSGIHEVDLLRHLVGRPVESVFAFGNRLGTLEFPGDKTTAALFRFAGGAVGAVTVTYEARWPKAGEAPSPLRLVCTRGVVADGRVAVDGRDDWAPLPAEAHPVAAGSRECVRLFLEAVAADRPVPVSGRDGFASLAACAAADRSAACGAAVAPETLD